MPAWGSWNAGNSWGSGSKPQTTANKPPWSAQKPGTGGIKASGTSTAGTMAPKVGQGAAGKPSIKPSITPGGSKPGQTSAKPPSGPPPGGVKRTGGPDGATAGSLAKKPTIGGKDPSFTVSTKSSKDEIGIQTLVGTYTEIGTNHTKKYYQKNESIPGHKDVKVFLYYWDSRDGADFSGWWFGDQLGGSQVWARCSSHGPIPPRVGWKIPWDAAKAEPGILFVDPYKKEEGKAAGAGAAKPGVTPGAAKPATTAAAATPGALAARVKKATTTVETAEKETKAVIEKAKALNGESTEAKLKEMLDTVTKQQTKLNGVQKSLTEDINETRKGGPTAVTSVTELSKLSPRLRTQISGITAELNKIKGFQAAAVKKAEQKKKDAANAEAQKKNEAAHTKEFEKDLPGLKEKVSSAEDSVEAVSIMAAPIVNDPPEDPGEATKKSMDEVEKSAGEAQTKINDARKLVQEKLQKARNYAPEARKKALAEYTALQDKLGEAQKKVGPYKTFKKDFAQRVEAKKALSDFAEKISAAELEVEKATMMSDAANQGQMSEDEIKSSEELITPANASVKSVQNLIDQKLKTAASFQKDELLSLKKRLLESTKKLNGVSTTLKRQREGLALQLMAGQVSEKIDAAEESMAKCQEAEMPFLKGIEVLPKDESDKALGESEAASSASSKLVEAAKKFLQGKIGEAKRYSKEASKTVLEELTELQQRLDEVAKKLGHFVKETQERKTAAVMAEVLESVSAAEKKCKELTEAATIFGGENLDDLVAEELKAAAEKCEPMEKEVSKALQEARAMLTAKQKTAKGGDLAQALQKVNGRVNSVQGDLSKAKKAVATCDRLIKGKALISEENEKVKEAEAKVESAEEKSKPKVEGEKLPEDVVKEMVAEIDSASKVLTACDKLLRPQLNQALPVLKTPLQTLVDRCTKASKTIETIKKETKDQIEHVMSDVYAEEGKGLAEGVEAALEKVNEAELPFLKGVETLPLKETQETIKASEEAAANVQKLVSEARNWLAQKNLEVKAFKSENAKATLEEFTKVTDKINSEANKLAQFRKDTEVRKKAAAMQEAGEKITVFEADVEKVAEAAKPFESEEPSDEDLAEKFKTLSELASDAKKNSASTKQFLMARKRDAAGNEEKTKYITDLEARLKTASEDLEKASKIARNHEQKFKAKDILEEALTKIAELDEVVKSGTEHCAPLIEEGGDSFVVGVRALFIADVLKEHMQEKSLTVEEWITSIGGVSGKVSKETFISYLAKMPEAFSREDLVLSEERQAAIFERLDVDKDLHISAEDFTDATKKTYVCVNGVSATSVFDIGASDCKTVTKLEKGDILEAHGLPKKEDKEGALPRIECKSKDGEKSGWVTMVGNGGTKYLEETEPITAFIESCEKKLKETSSGQAKIAAYFGSKMNELKQYSTGPLADAKADMAKHQAAVATAKKTIEDMKRKIAGSKKAHAVKVEEEANAHIVRKEQKEADSYLEVAKASEALMEAEMTKLADAAEPLAKLKGDEILAYATPTTVRTEVTTAAAAAKKVIEEAKTAIKEQQEKVAKATKGPLLDAKKELQALMNKTGKALGTVNTTVGAIKKSCSTIADSEFAKIATALRQDVQKNSIKLDELWTKLATAGENRITEDALVKHVLSVVPDIPEEHVQLAVQNLDVGGIGKRTFMGFLQQYYVVVKEIAITSTFELNTKDKPVRKAEIDEVFEVLEGPTTDEATDLVRVRAKSLNDSAEGWISVKGNKQGKVFLSEVEKPTYVATKEFPLETAFNSGGEEVRKVKPDEVLELIEGPRKETFGVGSRLRGKASSDGKTGWITIKDKHGAELAVKSMKNYTCVATVAMTDTFDIKTCKVVKKLAVDDVFTLTEGPEEDKEAGLVRVKGMFGDAEGWLTIKGNAGTVYAKVNEKLYTIEADEVPMHNKMSSSGATELRTLKKGETVEALEGPKDEKFAPATRLKCSVSGDGAAGWLTLEPGSISNFSGSYKVLKATPLHEAKAVTEESVRELAASEILELVEGPVEEDGKMRAKCRAKKDNVTGWVSLKDAEDKKNLQAL